MIVRILYSLSVKRAFIWTIKRKVTQKAERYRKYTFRIRQLWLLNSESNLVQSSNDCNSKSIEWNFESNDVKCRIHSAEFRIQSQKIPTPNHFWITILPFSAYHDHQRLIIRWERNTPTTFHLILSY